MFAAERLIRRLRPDRHSGAVATVTVPSVPRPVHSALVWLSRIDAAILRRRDLPFGSSVFVAAQRHI